MVTIEPPFQVLIQRGGLVFLYQISCSITFLTHTQVGFKLFFFWLWLRPVCLRRPYQELPENTSSRIIGIHKPLHHIPVAMWIQRTTFRISFPVWVFLQFVTHDLLWQAPKALPTVFKDGVEMHAQKKIQIGIVWGYDCKQSSYNYFSIKLQDIIIPTFQQPRH